MPVPFGIGVGDFLAVGQLAWSVYKSLNGAGSEFEEVSKEVYALHAALKELQEEIDHPDSIFSRSDARKKELTEVVQNCHSILQRLDNLLKKYTFDGTKSKRAWDRLRWGKENLPEIKEKIRSNTSALNLFLTTLSSGSLRRIETKLEQILEEVRAGKRKSTILAIAGDNQDEAELHWDMFERELVDDGFTKGELEGHKSWIKSKSMEFLLDETLQEEPLLENEGPGNSSPSSLSPEELKTSVPQPSNQPKICASGTQASLQTTFENVKDGIEKYYEAVLDRRKSEPKDSSGQELDCEEKSDLIPHSPKFVKSHSDEQSGDMSLPENPALNNGIIIKGISLVPYIHTPNPNSLITDQISYVENTAAKYQPSLGQFESIPVYPTSTEGTSHMSWYEVGGTCGASPPIRETFNEPGSPMPPTIFKNKVVEKPLLLTLEELFKGTNKKRKVKSRTNLQGTVYNIIVKPGQKRGDRFKFKNAGHQEVGGQQDLHFIIEEKIHTHFTREGNDLFIELELNPLESLYGWKRTVPMVHGTDMQLEKAGPTQPGSSDSYPNLGMPLLQIPDQRGNLIVKYTVKYPTSLSDLQGTQLRQALGPSH